MFKVQKTKQTKDIQQAATSPIGKSGKSSQINLKETSPESKGKSK